jgi:hypothetical protein
MDEARTPDATVINFSAARQRRLGNELAALIWYLLSLHRT